MLTFVCTLEDGQPPSFPIKWSKFRSMGEYPFAIDFCPPHSRWKSYQGTKLPEFPVFVSGDCISYTYGIGIFGTTKPPPNKRIEPMTSCARCQRHKFLAVDALLVTAHPHRWVSRC